ncbi:hypothetical protein HPB49_024444 [Dermacentor silvarum]|uniref:Uncharacterized protein n=1 Tax=Dermacentor silvarum TaxID=543639 RepID=A0ACB8CND5_DERSI|nr:hypothetical protein HPB49_024444 [Dermacentor silvarum]
MSAKGPRVSAEQSAILLQFIEQHPYLARTSTELSPRMTAARKNELWEQLAALLNEQGPAVKTPIRWRNHWAKLGHKAKKEAARAASEKRPTGCAGQVRLPPPPPPHLQQPQPYHGLPASQAPRRQATRQELDDVVCKATAECVRQGQSAEARAI